MKLTILGCYAATPRTFTNPTSQVLDIANHLFLIDCAEGTQVQLRKNKIKFSRINHIFISHLHGDHVYGLIGLISSFMLLKRQNDLNIYGPKGIKEMITIQLRLSGSWTSYGLFFHELESTQSQIVYEDDKVLVSTIPLQHRIYTNGYRFSEKLGLRKLNIDAAQNYEVDPLYYRNITLGKDVLLDNGTVISNRYLTFEATPPKHYAFCSDTLYTETIIPLIEGVDALYHESTFLNSEERLAEITMHSTAQQAGKIAKLANVKKLILGHYSTRYESITPFLEQAKLEFENVELADDGKSFEF
ncbi:ribonuclease Z [Flavobacterium ardleyense]|uniref:ribonuclease Z n=1 Tax=Flavobacterium ardleyense TaxID=2038737 RepID=UPI00298C048D|nr:ribonuclease Z [Flavobacterium ardleyense]